MDKTKKYLDKIKSANKAINDVIEKYNNSINTKFHKFLINKLELIKTDLELYKYEDAININSAVQRNYNINLNLNLNKHNSSELRSAIKEESKYEKVEIKKKLQKK